MHRIFSHSFYNWCCRRGYIFFSNSLLPICSLGGSFALKTHICYATYIMDHLQMCTCLFWIWCDRIFQCMSITRIFQIFTFGLSKLLAFVSFWKIDSTTKIWIRDLHVVWQVVMYLRDNSSIISIRLMLNYATFYKMSEGDN